MNGKLFTEYFQDRELLIYLPPSYESSKNRRYPVVYVHDKGEIFDPEFSHSLETIEHMFGEGDLGELILVGIDSSNRNDEYTPWYAKALVDYIPDFGGKGLEYLSYLVHELLPHINNNYRTEPGPAHTAILGASLGGLISMYAAYKYPEVFGKIGALSSSYWYEGFIEYMQTERMDSIECRIYMSIGTMEGATKLNVQKEMFPRSQLAYKLLLNSGFAPDRIRLDIGEGAVHDLPFFVQCFPGALQWLFPLEA
jgi:predicted alpha/beta superfamily hydrolase